MPKRTTEPANKTQTETYEAILQTFPAWKRLWNS